MCVWYASLILVLGQEKQQQQNINWLSSMYMSSFPSSFSHCKITIHNLNKIYNDKNIKLSNFTSKDKSAYYFFANYQYMVCSETFFINFFLNFLSFIILSKITNHTN